MFNCKYFGHIKFLTVLFLDMFFCPKLKSSDFFCQFINGFYVEIEPFFGILVWALFRPSKIAKPTVFQVVLRGIGKSFQSAITAPRMNLTGYDNATAQS